MEYEGSTMMRWMEKKRSLISVFLGTLLIMMTIFLIIEKVEYNVRHKQLQDLSAAYAQQLQMAVEHDTRRAKFVDAFVRMNPQWILGMQNFSDNRQDSSASLALQVIQNGQMTSGESVDGLVQPELWRKAVQQAKVTALQQQAMVLSAPFVLRDGGSGLAAVRPVYLFNKQTASFDTWGMSAMLLQVSSLINAADFAALEENGTAYRVEQLGEEGTEDILLAASPVEYKGSAVSTVVEMGGGRWRVSLAPAAGWLDCRTLALEGLASLLTAAALTFLLGWFQQLRRQREKMRLQAVTDPLTNLSNRHILMEELRERCKDSKAHFLVCYMDLDGFKEVNDTYGHDVGDQLIRAAADRVLGCLKPEDELYRLGGDEFVGILEEETEGGWKKRIDAIEQQLRGMFIFGDVCVEISVSVGCTIYPQTARTANELLREADQRMFETKERYSTKSR